MEEDVREKNAKPFDRSNNQIKASYKRKLFSHDPRIKKTTGLASYRWFYPSAINEESQATEDYEF